MEQMEVGSYENEVNDGSVSLRGHPVDRTKTGGLKAASFIQLLVSADALSTIGLAGNVFVYCITYLQMSLTETTNIVNNFMGITFLLPIAWGYLADTLLGRYITIVAASTILFVGLLVLTISASAKDLNPGKCILGPACQHASENQITWFYSGLFLCAIGSAGLKPCISSMGQDQFDETHPKEKKQGRYFFTSYYMNVNVTMIFAVTLGFYIQTDKGFHWGWGSICAYFILCFGAFVFATPFYRHRKPEGSALDSVVQVLFVALKNARKQIPSNETLYEIDDSTAKARNIRKLAHTDRLRFLDKAAIFTHENSFGTVSQSWEACTLTQVEELKSVIQILPIWVCTIVVYTIFAQIFSVTVGQATTLDRRLGRHFVIPAASTVFFMVASAAAFIPFYEVAIVPVLRKMTGHSNGLSDLKRICVAIFISSIAMIIAALVEGKRVKVTQKQGNAINFTLLAYGEQQLPMSIFWLFPQYMLLGIVEFLIGVAQLNFFYSQTPESMRSLATSLFFSTISVGHFLSSALLKVVNSATSKEGRGGWIDYDGGFFTGGVTRYYYLLAIIVAIDLAICIVCTNWYAPALVQHKKPLSQYVDQGSYQSELDTTSTLFAEDKDLETVA